MSWAKLLKCYRRGAYRLNTSNVIFATGTENTKSFTLVSLSLVFIRKLYLGGWWQFICKELPLCTVSLWFHNNLPHTGKNVLHSLPVCCQDNCCSIPQTMWLLACHWKGRRADLGLVWLFTLFAISVHLGEYINWWFVISGKIWIMSQRQVLQGKDN